MSTAAAPDARAISFRSEIESTIDGDVKSFATRGERSVKIRWAFASKPLSEKFSARTRSPILKPSFTAPAKPELMTIRGRALWSKASTRALQCFAPTPVWQIATGRLSIWPETKSSCSRGSRNRRRRSVLSVGSAKVIAIIERRRCALAESFCLPHLADLPKRECLRQAVSTRRRIP